MPFGGFRIGGYNVPRALVHNPLFETMHFFATMRRVYEGEREGGDVMHAVGSAAAGATEEVPFIDVPQRIGKAYEHKAGFRNLAGEVVRSATIPPDVQRAAAMSDSAEPTTIGQKALQVTGLKDVKSVKRSPQGFIQTFEMGVPGLRQRVPINARAAKAAQKAALIEGVRNGRITSADLQDMVDNEKMTEAEKGAIEQAGTLSEFAQQFRGLHNDKALERYKNLVRFNDPRQYEVEEIMREKAKTLVNSKSLLPSQREKFRQQLEEVGISP